MYQTMRRCIDLYGIEVLPMKKSHLLPYELADRLNMPEDVLLGAAKLTVTAGRRALVENHRGVIDYSEERIVIASGRGTVSIMGAKLCIAAMNRAELLITGRIQSVEWE